MRVLIMILILMDYVKKDATRGGACKPKKDCKSSTTVVSSDPHTDSTPEATTAFTPAATSTHTIHTTMMSTPLEGSLTEASIETATDSTQNSNAQTTKVAELPFNSSTNGSTVFTSSATITSSTAETEPSTLSEYATSSPLFETDKKTTFNSLTNGSTRVITSPTISSPTTEAESSRQPEDATTSPLSVIHKKSVPASVIAGSIGGIVIFVLLTIGLVILFRKRKQRYSRQQDEMCKNIIHFNPAFNEHCAPSADNVSASSKDSGFGIHNESMEAEMMDGEYNTLRLHFPVTNETPDVVYNHIDGPLTADSTYSHILNSKDALFDNTYSHMPNVTHGKSLEPDDKDATYNHLGDSCSSKHKGKTQESRDETYNHAQMSHVRPTADQEDPEDDYSHINLSGLEAQIPNTNEHRVDLQAPTHTRAGYAKANNVTKVVDKGKKQHSDARKGSTTTAEGGNSYEGHTYFVLESNTDQHPKQAQYDYAVEAAPEEDHTEFTVVETDTQHEYFVLEPTTEL